MACISFLRSSLRSPEVDRPRYPSLHNKTRTWYYQLPSRKLVFLFLFVHVLLCSIACCSSRNIYRRSNQLLIQRGGKTRRPADCPVRHHKLTGPRHVLMHDISRSIPWQIPTAPLSGVLCFFFFFLFSAQFQQGSKFNLSDRPAGGNRQPIFLMARIRSGQKLPFLGLGVYHYVHYIIIMSVLGVG